MGLCCCSSNRAGWQSLERKEGSKGRIKYSCLLTRSSSLTRRCSTWSNSFFCLNLSPSASAIIRRSFLSSASCFSIKCLVSRACCLSFCSSAWQRVEDTGKFQFVTAQTRTTGPGFRCTVVLLTLSSDVSFNTVWSLSQAKQAYNTHTHTHTHKEIAMNITVIMFILSCALEGFLSFFYICVAGASLVFSSTSSLTG